MKYMLSAVAIAALILTACSEGRKTPDGYEMDNPPPSAYAPSDYETFDPNLNDFEAEEAEINDE